MKDIIIAFDVDGTLLNNEGIPPKTPAHLRPATPLNLEIVMLMQLLTKHMKNTKRMAKELGIGYTHYTEILNNKRALSFKGTAAAYKLGVPALTLLK